MDRSPEGVEYSSLLVGEALCNDEVEVVVKPKTPDRPRLKVRVVA